MAELFLNLVYLKNWLSRKETWCAGDIYNHVRSICAKAFLDSNLNEALIYKKYQIFSKWLKISHIPNNRIVGKRL